MPDIVDIIFKGSVAELQRELDSGIDIEALDKYGFTLLVETILASKLEMSALLLTAGAQVDHADYTGKTPLHWAVDRNNYTICKLLLEHGANPAGYSLDSQPIMLNAVMRDNKKLVTLLVKHGADLDFVTNYISAKLVGHRFALAGTVDILNPKGKLIELKYEGFYLEFTVELLRQSLEKFVLGVPKAQTGMFAMYIKKILRALHYGSDLMEYKYAETASTNKTAIYNIFKEDLQLIPVSYAGHAITLVKYGNLLVKCDRGVNKLTDTIIIYKITNPYIFTSEFIWDLLYSKRSPTEKFINIEMKVELGLQPVATLPVQSQVSGNCSWANVEAAIPAMLLLLSFPRALHDKRAVSTAKRKVMSFYKAWVAWDKERMFTWSLEEFFAANQIRKISHAQLLCSILVQRCDYHNGIELNRAKRILPLLTLPRYQFILQSYIKIYCHTRLGKISKVGKNFNNILQEFGLSFSNLNLTYPLHLAAIMGDLGMVQYLLEEALTTCDVNEKDYSGSTPLMYATSKGHFPVVQYLIDRHQADLNIKNHKGATALGYAQHGGYKEVTQYLVTYQNQ
ncbi:MAG: hypothetical protein COC15_01295 [Legionellales bacterium]|nr:MAG: hypothetical protein COC15_01295 [Legionellales bacterium]